MKNRRWNCIDGMYAAGTILVILGHSHSSDWTSFYRTPLERMLLFIYMFHMPLFFSIAGFLFSNSDSLDRNGYGNWLYRKALRILTPYLALSLPTVLLKYYLDQHGFAGLTPQYLVKGLLIPRSNVWGHFWFLPVLLELYAVFGFAYSLAAAANEQVMWRLLLAGSILLYFYPLSSGWLGMKDFCQAAVYFSVGGIVNSRLRQRGPFPNSGKRKLLRAAGSLAISVMLASPYILAPEETSGESFSFRVRALVTALLMIVFCAETGQCIGNRAWAGWISRHTLTLYIFAWPFQYPVMVLCSRMGAGWQMTSILMFTAGITIPVLFILAYERLQILHHPFIDLIIGVRPAPQTDRPSQ